MRRWLLIAGVMLLGGCGWQLQGARHIDAALLPVYLDLQDDHSMFAQALQQQFRLSGMPVVTDATLAHSTLVVTTDDSGHHVVSVSALNEPQQYEVYYTVSYRLIQHRGEQADTLLSVQAMTLTNTMSYDKTVALAKQREESVLVRQLAEEQALQLLRRLQVVKSAMRGAP